MLDLTLTCNIWSDLISDGPKNPNFATNLTTWLRISLECSSRYRQIRHIENTAAKCDHYCTMHMHTEFGEFWSTNGKKWDQNFDPPKERRSCWAFPHILVVVHCGILCIVVTYSTFGDRAFGAAGPGLWNSLSSHLKDTDISYSEFRRSLKTFLFGQWGRGTVWTLLTAPTRNILTYLLTYLLTCSVLGECYRSECQDRPWVLGEALLWWAGRNGTRNHQACSEGAAWGRPVR